MCATPDMRILKARPDHGLISLEGVPGCDPLHASEEQADSDAEHISHEHSLHVRPM